MTFVLRTAKFSKALQEYQEATKKDMVIVLNRALKNVGFRAAQFTPQKSPAEIEAELRKDKIALKIITKKLVARKGKTFKTKKGSRTIKRVTRKQIGLRTKQFIQRRKKRVGFLRAGWIAALVASGVVKHVAKSTIIRDGKSVIGSGKAATADHLRAYLGNAVWGRLTGKSAGKTKNAMIQALNRAMSFVADDMTQYARETMKKTARRFSGKRK